MSDTNFFSPMEQLQQCLVNSKKAASQLALKTENQTVMLKVESTLQQLINQVGFFIGKVDDAEKEEFKPIVIENEFEQKVQEVILDPNEEDKKAFFAKVETVQSSFENLEDDKIIKNILTPEDEFALRAVAKRAGVEDFETKEVNTAFVEEIRIGLELLKENQTEQQLIDAASTTASKTGEETVTE